MCQILKKLLTSSVEMALEAKKLIDFNTCPKTDHLMEVS